MTEKPFTITIPDTQLSLLKQKLELTRLPDEVEGVGWEHGAPRVDVERLLARWKDGYDWRAEEAALNKELPMFTRDISVEGHGVLNIHYVHRRSTVRGAVPLLFVHGWPGSFIEVRKILPLLVAPDDTSAPAFHVVALGLPGFGFSEGAKKPGFGARQMAEVGHKLMISLGYDEYICQGGDFGYLVTMIVASTYGPKHAKAWHTNMPDRVAPSVNMPYSERDREALKRKENFLKTEYGFVVLQSTKPQTLGYSLSDSPVGLLAWIYEKLVAWTDGYAWTDDEILTWISIHWFSRAGPTSAIRLHYETRVGGYHAEDDSGVNFKPESWITPHGELVQAVRHDRGGHFPAYEVPDSLVDDLRKMFGQDGPAYRAVLNSDGY
ncbi:unnamed protein product [Peniophora sp. CBMAI 1063]|nr:unnamed protein product [Peniophora sp. CBMAI 1063]